MSRQNYLPRCEAAHGHRFSALVRVNYGRVEDPEYRKTTIPPGPPGKVVRRRFLRKPIASRYTRDERGCGD
jgi:hypothetical protein